MKSLNEEHTSLPKLDVKAMLFIFDIPNGIKEIRGILYIQVIDKLKVNLIL